MNHKILKKFKLIKFEPEPDRGKEWSNVNQRMLNQSSFDFGKQLALFGFSYNGAFRIFEASEIFNKDANLFQEGWESVSTSNFGNKWVTDN